MSNAASPGYRALAYSDRDSRRRTT